MKIRKVILENVKSYQREEIEFHDGVNVIAGRNGAGKSTLIEAIGLALFGYMNKDYNYQDFVSYGATSGGITVEFEVDNCRYRIERTFSTRGTKGWVIQDLQTDEVIETHTVEDVNYTLSRILGMSEEISLAELFERIIGVSQGTFTEPFLRSTNGRKEYFERIFMLDSYKAAYLKSNDTASLFRGQVDDLEKELIRLRTRVEEYPLRKIQAKEEESRLIERKKQWEEQLTALQKVKSELQTIKTIREMIQELENTQVQLTEQQKQLEERIRTTEEAIATSEQAKALVEAYTETHTRYLHWRETINNMEQQLDIHEQLIAEKQKLETDLAIAQENWKGRQVNLESTRSALITEAKEKLEEIEEYDLPLKGIEKELKTVNEELEKTEKITAELAGVVQGYQTCEKYLQQLCDRLAERGSLLDEVRKLDERLQCLPELEVKVAQLPACEKEWEEVNHTISSLETRIATEKENMEQVGDGLCPLLKRECKTIEGQNLREYFRNSVVKLEGEWALELEKKAGITTQLQNLRKDAQQLTTLLTLVAARDERQEKMGSVEERIMDLIRQFDATLLDLYSRLGAFKKAGYLVGAGDLTYKEGLLLDLAREEKRLMTELDIFLNYIVLGQNEVKAREKKYLEKKEELAQRRSEFYGKISQIRERRAAIERRLIDLTNQEEELAQEKLRFAESEEKIQTLTTTLQSFGDLKGELKKARDELAQLEEGNQMYLKHEQKAEELPGLQDLVDRLKVQFAKTVVSLEKTAAQLSEESRRVDSALITQLEGQADALHELTSQTKTLIQEGERRWQELTDRLKEMEQVKVQIKAKEGEESRLKKALDLMNFIRNVYNSSAEEIAQVFLQFISHEATNLYRQLSGENVQLIWEKDYQIKLKDKHRVRIFKQLSGGEQMSAAFAIRLALLRKFSTVRLGFFDEPTTHLDEYRRMNIAQAIANIREKSDDYFEQIFVISHDDTFTTLTENLIRLEKDEDGSYLATAD